MNKINPLVFSAVFKVFFLLAALPIQATAAQRSVAPLPPVETFTEADAPAGHWDGYKWEQPWGYNRPENSERLYPLIVFGPHNEVSFFRDTAQKQFPAFYLQYSEDTVAGGESLSDRIDARMSQQGFRIDLNRIYLTGYSAGGSGSYKTIRGFLNKGKCFAGLIRIAGQSESILDERAIDKIAISMHIGLNDTLTRIQVSRALYAHIRNHPSNAAAVETILDEPEFGRTTKVLTLDGVDVIRYSEYPDMFHSKEEPYADPAIFQWIMTRAISANQPTTATLSISVSGNGSTSPQAGTHTVNVGSPAAITATPEEGSVFVNWTATSGASITDSTAASTTATLTTDATVTAIFTEAGSGEGDWRILTPNAAGTAVVGTYFPLANAFDAQPSWDANAKIPVGEAVGEHAPSYSGRYGYVDFGSDFDHFRIVETWTQYRTYSSGDQAPFAELWWDNNPGINKIDPIAEARFNFNSAQGLQNTGENVRWIRDSSSSAPITPLRRYLILRSPDTVTNRAQEFAFVGYIESLGNTPPTLVSPGSRSIEAGQSIHFQLEEATDPDGDSLAYSATGPIP